MKDLIQRLEAATGPHRDLDAEIWLALNPQWRDYTRDDRGDQVGWITPHDGRAYLAHHYTESIDDAMTLLPATSCNHDLFSFIGHGRDDIGQTAWGFQFHDTAQLVGIERAKAQVRRLRKDYPLGSGLRGAPKSTLENAIAEHFCEFSGTHAPNPAIAICIAALKARMGGNKT